jgi:hypothetical protein
MAGFTITTQDDLPGPDGDEPYVLFVNQTEYGNARFLRTNVLSARPDLKKYSALRFRQEVKRHPEPGEDGPKLPLVALPWLPGLQIPEPAKPKGVHHPPDSGEGRLEGLGDSAESAALVAVIHGLLQLLRIERSPLAAANAPAIRQRGLTT